VPEKDGPSVVEEDDQGGDTSIEVEDLDVDDPDIKGAGSTSKGR
jgi:hypothetical protein